MASVRLASAFVECFADAENHPQSRRLCRFHLAVDEYVVLAQFVPAFAVAEDDVLAAGIDEHGRADLAGEGAFLFGIEILCAESDLAAADNPGDLAEIRKRRTDRHGHTVFIAETFHHSLG